MLGWVMQMRRRTCGVALCIAMVLLVAACGTTVPPSQRAASRGDVGLADTSGTVAGASSATEAIDGAGTTASAAAETGTVATNAVDGGAATQPQAAGGAGASGSGGSGASLPGGAMAATGRGWDAKNVYIGVILSKDTSQSTGALGLDNIDPGDNQAQAIAVAKYYNGRGGLFGRQIVVRIDDHSLTAALSRPEVEGQAACTKFVQDQPVVAVVNTLGPLDTPTLRGCFAKAGLPLMNNVNTAVTELTLSAKTTFVLPAPTWSRLSPVYVASLVEQKYFTGWNTSAGGPGPAPVKLGIWMKDDTDSNRAFASLSAALAKAGHQPAVVFKYGNFASEAGNAVLQMRTAGVTHVIGLDPYLFAFASAAESQGYRPRYGVQSGNVLQPLLQMNSPKTQLVGAVGLGYSPFADVGSQTGEITPGGKLCHEIMAANGQTFQGKRGAEWFAFFVCDSMRLAVDSLLAGGGLAPAALLAGAAKVGPTFATALMFKSGMTGDYHAMPAAGLDVRYQTSCSCFQYAGTAQRAF